MDRFKDMVSRVAARYESAAKPEFYTPASFKSVADKYAASLKDGTGVEWKMVGVQKSNRKTIEGAENYLSAKFYPADRSKPMSAELSVSMIAKSSGPTYQATAVLEQSMRTVFEEHHDTKDFSDMARWVLALKPKAS